MKVATDGCLFGSWVAADLVEAKLTSSALDIGAGTGLLSLMIAQKNDLLIDAVEIDYSSAKQAVENIDSSPFSNKIKVYHEDINTFNKGDYNIIYSNPPFYENELESPSSSKNLAHHSSNLKWKDLFNIISSKLQEDGKFYLLLPWKRKTDAEQGLESERLFIEKMVLVKDKINSTPSRLLIKGGKQKLPFNTNEIIIRQEDGNYTSKFTTLLKDYYLNL